MKRIIAVIILCCVICMSGCTKVPEEFTVRNGIKFGMSPEEVVAIEGKNIISDIGDTLIYQDVIMGADTEILFSFEEDGLSFIMYDIDDKIHPDHCESNYNAINETLREKYGKEVVSTIEIDKNNGTEDWITIWNIPQKNNDVEILHIAVKDSYGYFWVHMIRYINDGEGYDYTVKDYQLNADKL